MMMIIQMMNKYWISCAQREKKEKRPRKMITIKTELQELREVTIKRTLVITI